MTTLVAAQPVDDLEVAGAAPVGESVENGEALADSVGVEDESDDQVGAESRRWGGGYGGYRGGYGGYGGHRHHHHHRGGYYGGLMILEF